MNENTEGAQNVQEKTVVADVIRCKKFLVENDKGHVGVEITMNANGNPEIVIFDADGNRRIVQGIFDDVPTLAMLDKNAVSRLALQVGPKTTGMALRDLASNVRSSLAVSHEGDAALLLLNRERQVAVSVECRDSIPAVRGFDLESNPVFWVLPEPEPAPVPAVPPSNAPADLAQAVALYNCCLSEIEIMDAQMRATGIKAGNGQACAQDYKDALRVSDALGATAAQARYLRQEIVASPLFAQQYSETMHTNAHARLMQNNLGDLRFIERAETGGA